MKSQSNNNKFHYYAKKNKNFWWYLLATGAFSKDKWHCYTFTSFQVSSALCTRSELSWGFTQNGIILTTFRLNRLLQCTLTYLTLEEWANLLSGIVGKKRYNPTARKIPKDREISCRLLCQQNTNNKATDGKMQKTYRQSQKNCVQ